MMAAFDVLVLWEGNTHSATDEAIAAIHALGISNDFSVTDSGNSSGLFTAESLGQYDAVVFLNTEGDILNASEETAFQNYVQQGGGFVGIHAAANAETSWTWFGDLLGARYGSQSAVVQATVKVADHVHDSTTGLPDLWVRTDQWFTFNLNPRGNVHVLATLDESSYTTITQQSQVDHPISWYKYVDGGRSWYTGMGHTEASYSEQNFLNHLLGGLSFAAGHAPADLGASINANWQSVVLVSNPEVGSPQNSTPTLENPVALAVAPNGDVFITELWTGKVKVYDSTTGMFTTAADLNVFRREGAGESQGRTEDGLPGIALDPNFMANGWVYLFYSPAGPDFYPVGPKEEQYVSRFTYNFVNKTLDLNSEKILLKIPVNRARAADNNDGHTAGSLAFGPDSTLYISVGDDTNPHGDSAFNYAPLDERPGLSGTSGQPYAIWDAQRSSSNTNDLRGKILRIKPEDDGTYSIPAGNLFTGDAAHRPEIYVMGNRNPYRIAVDQETGWLYWGEVGPDAGSEDANKGPRGYDEINQAREAGNFGWPYAIADNKTYRAYDWVWNDDPWDDGTAPPPAPPLFDPNNLQNNSPNNTGAVSIPDAQPALIWYPYATTLSTNAFPEMITGTSTRMALTAGVYHFDPSSDSSVKFPEYFDDTLIVFDWGREAFWEVKLDDDGDVLKINRMFPNLSFQKPIAAQFGSDGALYVLEWGDDYDQWQGDNNDAQLVRIEFTGNLPALLGDYNRNGEVDAADYVVWRHALGETGLGQFEGADGSGNGTVGPEDLSIWRAHFGASISGAGSSVSALTSTARTTGGSWASVTTASKVSVEHGGSSNRVGTSVGTPAAASPSSELQTLTVADMANDFADADFALPPDIHGSTRRAPLTTPSVKRVISDDLLLLLATGRSDNGDTKRDSFLRARDLAVTELNADMTPADANQDVTIRLFAPCVIKGTAV